KDIRKYHPNPDIAGRYYQKEAIQRICETFVRDGEEGITSNRRKALAVMATGSGKTRTAIALVDILMKANWAKRVLFLADRKALVTQAKRSFNDNLGHLTAIDLTKEIEDNTTRLVFSTYPTISNRIDNAKNEDGTVYGVGHFDLIIVDEAHRSIYKKYEDIFHYFDSLVVGLTATPKDETHVDTYQAFDCENENPTYFYELDQAIKDGYLVPPKKIKMGTKFMRRGIKYSELTKAEKDKFEKLFAARGEEVPDIIDPSAINRWLFNKDTVVKVLDALMTMGHKVESGDKIGKTIIFAKSQDHADFIQKIFDEQYPEHKGIFAQTISHRDKKYAQDLIDKFKEPKRYPQIAISVDMLETGIDVPEIVNLVLFKPIYSVSKFWQIIGRGTRLCENLYNVEQHKEDFYVFDCFGNCDYFEALLGEETIEGPALQKSVSHRIFELRIQLAEALRDSRFQAESMQTFRNDLLAVSHELVNKLYEQRKEIFRVRMRLDLIKKYKDRAAWNNLSSDLQRISDEIGPLVTLKDKDEKAKLFDALLYKMQLAYCNGEASFERGKQNLVQRARRLATMSNIPIVRDKMPLITRIQSESFWKELSFPSLEKIRIDLRDLMSLLKSDKQDIAYTNFADELGEVSEPEEMLLPSAPANYLDRVRSFIRNNQDYMIIQKLRTNKPITSKELEQLEQLLFDGGERGTKADFIKATDTSQPIGQFIRSILGLDRNAAMAAFSTFLAKGNLTANQQQFLEIIISHFTVNGHLNPAQLYESPYTDIDMAGLDGVFNDDDCSMIVSIIRGVNGNAEVA
ncbi:MAG: DEAD/DEAH box helicase family protein, partial [Saprospiraceae bacterium]